jgi:hypothetical protein
MVQQRTAVRQVTPDCIRCKSSHLGKVLLVAPEQFAHATLQKSRLLSVLSKHVKKVMQGGAIILPLTAHS